MLRAILDALQLGCKVRRISGKSTDATWLRMERLRVQRLVHSAAQKHGLPADISPLLPPSRGFGHAITSGPPLGLLGSLSSFINPQM
mmetsp:Transcript_42919/g.80077  ORF Transcript_42919/g.80077 Transcript_42919/m.80077 type:complete len:87 (-) Transcript_42919:339-599(-)